MADGSGRKRLRPCVEHIADLRLDDPELHGRAVDALFQEHGLLSKYTLPPDADRAAPTGRRWVQVKSRLGVLVWKPAADSRREAGAGPPKNAQQQRATAAGSGADHAAGEQAARALAADVRTAGLSLRDCGRRAVPLAPVPHLPARTAGTACAGGAPPAGGGAGGAWPCPRAEACDRDGAPMVLDPDDVWEEDEDEGMSDGAASSSSRSDDLDFEAASADADSAEDNSCSEESDISPSTGVKAENSLFASPNGSTELAAPKLEFQAETKAAGPGSTTHADGRAAAAAGCELSPEGERELAARKAAAARIVAGVAAMGSYNRVAAALAEGSTPPPRAGRPARTTKKMPAAAAGPRLAISTEAVPAAPAEIRRLAKAGDASVDVRGPCRP